MTKNKLLLIVFACLIVVFAGGCADKNANIIGGEKDEGGCLTAAGYSWCAEKNKCLRPFEEFCPGSATTLVADIENGTGAKLLPMGDADFSWLFENVDHISQAEVKGVVYEIKNVDVVQYEKIEKSLNEKIKADNINVADGVGAAVRGYVDGYMACLLEYPSPAKELSDVESPVAGKINVSLMCGYFNPNDKSMNILN